MLLELEAGGIVAFGFFRLYHTNAFLFQIKAVTLQLNRRYGHLAHTTHPQTLLKVKNKEVKSI
ncbi:MAG: hypothetical protein EGR76_03915 [Prevotella stercorea]|nr:hypothetical protein [Leyella stercorea]